jgi:hypothetical protein
MVYPSIVTTGTEVRISSENSAAPSALTVSSDISKRLITSTPGRRPE